MLDDSPETADPRHEPDLIDELDEVVNEPDPDEDEDEDEAPDAERSMKYRFDHVSGVIRRPFDKRSIDQWDDYDNVFDQAEEAGKVVFGSDDVPVDEEVREKMVSVRRVEDVFLLKGSRLREGWGPWFDAKSDFLRRDKMFRSNLEGLNPLNNPMLQDPDGNGFTGLTKGDKLVQKWLLHEFKKVPFLGKKTLSVDEGSTGRVIVKDGENASMKKPLVIKDSTRELVDNGKGLIEMSTSGVISEPKIIEELTHESGAKSVPESEEKSINIGNGDLSVENKQLGDKMKRVERRTLVEKASKLSNGKRDSDNNGIIGKDLAVNVSSNVIQTVNLKPSTMIKQRSSGEVYANGKRWGYFPGLQPRLSFSNFMDAFFRKGKCSIRFFMVWNSPPWMFTVRQQRGIESLFLNHRNACLVVFSETIELNFFEGLVNEGFKVAVAMPNLDELLKDTPSLEFASVWYEWRKTRYYSTHYSELVRLAALYKYGGIYLDSDIIVLKPLSSLVNTVGLEDPLDGSSLNGAVMSFRKYSPFIMECLTEFYSTYDDKNLRWNGADLLTRVAKNYSRNMNNPDNKMELNLQHSSLFFPIDRDNIIRYFYAPEIATERAEQDELLQEILNESFTFHYWNSLTFSLVPEPESLVARIINQYCIHCNDVL